MIAWWVSLAAASEVRIDWERYRALIERPEAVAPWAPAPVAVRRDVVARLAEGGVAVEARWWFEGEGAVALDLPLQVLSAQVDGRAVGVAQGVLHFVARGRHRVDVSAFVPGDPRRDTVKWSLPAAAVGSARVANLPADQTATWSEPFLSGDAATAWTGASPLSLRLTSRGLGGAADLVGGRCGVGVFVDETSVSVAIRAEAWPVAGNLDRVTVVVPGAPVSAEASGWARQGDRFTATSSRRLDLRWTTPWPSGAQPVPACAVEGAVRHEATLVVGRDRGVDVVPSVPMTSIPVGELPPSMRDLVDQPSVAFTSAGAPRGSLSLTATVPADLPAVMVDTAQYTVATSSEGRALVRAQLAVRNDRASTIGLDLPAGTVVVAVRVAGRSVEAVRAGQRLDIPLPRSAEVVDGLLGVSVEAVLLVPDTGWRGTGALPLPAVAAEVAVMRALVHVPPGWRARAEPGVAHVVSAFGDGGAFHYGYADPADARVAQADATLQRAVDAWMSGDVDEVQANLDALGYLGAKNEDISRLAANVAALADDEEDDAERRVKEVQKARTLGERDRQQALIEQADEALARGDAEVAERAYEAAAVVGGKLKVFEKKEDADVDARNRRADAGVAAARRESAKSAPANDPEPAPEPVVDLAGIVASPVAGVQESPRYRARTEIDFEDTPIEAPARPSPGAGGGTAEGAVGMGGGYGMGSGPPTGTRGTVVSKDSLAKVPTGRSYQSAVPAADDVTGEDGNAPLAVRAVSDAGIIPAVAPPVLFERHLLPPGGGGSVQLFARPPSRRSP